MTDPKLLPLYAELQGHPKIEIIKHYARANVAHATAPLQAEIEALRALLLEACDDGDEADADLLATLERARTAEARAERLAEALREAREIVAAHASKYMRGPVLLDKINALLHDHDQEVSNG